MLSVLGLLVPFAAALAQKPNIVLIYLDDAGYGDFGFTGHPTIRTPNLDKLGTQSMLATQYYTVSPACSASRYALLTGRYPHRSGFGWVLSPDSRERLAPSELTLAEALRANGYRTHMLGKWHLGFPNEKNDFDAGSLPLAHGFDSYFGIPYSSDMVPPNYPDLKLIQNDTRGHDPVPGYKVAARNPDPADYTSLFTRKAVERISEKSDRPFFLYLAHPMPHVPLAARRRSSARGLYGDVIEELDSSVGQIVEAIRRQRLESKTILVLASDNGPWILRGLNGGSSGLYKDGKGSTWEGGIRVPFLAWAPGRLKPSSVRYPFASIDLMPTLLAWAGAPKVTTTDGVNVMGLWRGDKSPERTLAFWGPGNELFAIRKGPWKLHLKTTSQIGMKYFDDPLPLLFQVELDPSETKNVAPEHPEIVASLKAEAVRIATKK